MDRLGCDVLNRATRPTGRSAGGRAEAEAALDARLAVAGGSDRRGGQGNIRIAMVNARDRGHWYEVEAENHFKGKM